MKNQTQNTQPETLSAPAEESVTDELLFVPRIAEINLRVADKINRRMLIPSEKIYEPAECCFQCGVEFKRSDRGDKTAVYAMSYDRLSQIWMHRACAFKFGEELTVLAMVRAVMATKDPAELRRLRVCFRHTLEEIDERARFESAVR